MGRFFCLPEGKCFAFPMLPSRPFAAPAGENLVAPARGDRVIQTVEAVKKDADRIFAITAAR